MHIWEKIKKDDLLRHSALLFVSMLIVHVSNILFQWVMGWALPREEFALLQAFLASLMILRRPLGTLRTAVCYYGSLLEQEGRRGDVKRLLRKWLSLTAVPAVLGGLLAILFCRPLAQCFHLARTAPVIIAGAVFPALFWLPIFTGAAQGMQKFGWTSTAAIVGALVRLGLGAGFTLVLYSFCGWAMLGHGLSLYVTAGMLFIALWMALHGRPAGTAPLPSMRLYLVQSFFILAAYAVLMTADVVLIKHYIPADSEFAYAATLGRMVVFLPGAIAAAMFPKVASKGGVLTRRQKQLFLRSFGYTALFVGVAVLGCYLLPGLLLKIMYPKVDPSGYLKGMVGFMAAVMALNALLNVAVQFLMAQRRFLACIPTLVFAVLYLVGARFFHAGSWQVITLAGLCNLGALLFGWFGIMRVKVEG